MKTHSTTILSVRRGNTVVVALQARGVALRWDGSPLRCAATRLEAHNFRYYEKDHPDRGAAITPAMTRLAEIEPLDDPVVSSYKRTPRIAAAFTARRRAACGT